MERLHATHARAGQGFQIYPGIARRLLEGAAQCAEVRLQLAAQLLVEGAGGGAEGQPVGVRGASRQFVYWGDQTWEEMMIGWFDYTVDSQDLRKETALLK